MIKPYKQHLLLLLALGILQSVSNSNLLAQNQPAALLQGIQQQSIVQYPVLPRLTTKVLDVTAPSVRVEGTPGSMRIIDRSCRSAPLNEVRRRIINTAVQEWAWFGFQIDDMRESSTDEENMGLRRFLPLNPTEVMQVATTVGGYWSAAPGSDWILQRQNDVWKRANGMSSRWRDPWSAAFVSWVMCESGMGDKAQFQRAIAHHTYIDQAIRATDKKQKDAAYLAYQPGEAEILPGDLLCSGLRPMYTTLKERRSQLGVGARTHCDIVVKVDTTAMQILTIGGNVRASVRMKNIPAGFNNKGDVLVPVSLRRPIFAHLKLQTAVVEADALSNTPTLQQLACTSSALPVTFTIANLSIPTRQKCD